MLAVATKRSILRRTVGRFSLLSSIPLTPTRNIDRIEGGILSDLIDKGNGQCDFYQIERAGGFAKPSEPLQS